MENIFEVPPKAGDITPEKAGKSLSPSLTIGKVFLLSTRKLLVTKVS